MHPSGMPSDAGQTSRPFGYAVLGRLLEPGDVLQATDVYSSSNGYFEPCPCPGITLQGTAPGVLWVRPS